MRVDLALQRNAIFDLLKGLVEKAYVVFAVLGTGHSFLLVWRRVELIKVESFHLLLQNVDNLLSRVLFIFRVAGSDARLRRLEVAIINLDIRLTQILDSASRNPNYLCIAVLVGDIAEENVEGAIVEDYDKLVGVLFFLASLEPPHVVDLASLFHFFLIVVLYNDSLVFELGVVAANGPCFGP